MKLIGVTTQPGLVDPSFKLPVRHFAVYQHDGKMLMHTVPEPLHKALRQEGQPEMPWMQVYDTAVIVAMPSSL